MRNAFETGTIVAIVAGVVGYFVIIRKSAFAAHALSHVGFAGAAGAVYLGLSPIVGLLSFTMGGAVFMGALGKKAASRDTQIGIVLAFMLGLGILFISLYQGYSSEAYSILFGQILGISSSDVIFTVISGVAVLAVVIFIYHPLLFASVDEEVASASGANVTLISLGFMILVAFTVSIAVQVIGVLLIFALLVTPAAAGVRLTGRPLLGLVYSIAIGLLITWIGLFLAFYSPYPVSFFITAIGFLVYLGVRGFSWFRHDRSRIVRAL